MKFLRLAYSEAFSACTDADLRHVMTSIGEKLTAEQRAYLVQLITGTSKVPLEGFSALQGMRGPQKFNIHKVTGGDTARLPTSHTCFNQLDLPEYESLDVLRSRLVMALEECHSGFGFV